jgi:hypothetical protein
MTTLPHTAAASATTHTARRIFGIALTLALAAALVGAWLALFTFVPFDLTPQR